MKKRSGFLIGLATAAITFGALFATLGKEHFAGCSNHWKHHHCHGHHQGCQSDTMLQNQ